VTRDGTKPIDLLTLAIFRLPQPKYDIARSRVSRCQPPRPGRALPQPGTSTRSGQHPIERRHADPSAASRSPSADGPRVRVTAQPGAPPQRPLRCLTGLGPSSRPPVPLSAPRPFLSRHVEDGILPLKQTVLQGSDPSIPSSTDATPSCVPVVASTNDTRFAASCIRLAHITYTRCSAWPNYLGLRPEPSRSPAGEQDRSCNGVCTGRVAHRGSALRVGWRSGTSGVGWMDERRRSRRSGSSWGTRFVVGWALIGLGVVVGIIAALLG
jgi:hypothetical protein